EPRRAVNDLVAAVSGRQALPHPRNAEEGHAGEPIPRSRWLVGVILRKTASPPADARFRAGVRLPPDRPYHHMVERAAPPPGAGPPLLGSSGVRVSRRGDAA